MFEPFKKPIKMHIADAYSTRNKPIVYDADTIDTETNEFKTLYLIYGIIDSEENLDINYIKSLGCQNPKIYNPNSEESKLMIGGIWLE